MDNAHYATLAYYLGLRSKDLAEIGGFSDRYARDCLKGKAAFHNDLIKALQLIQDDIEVVVDVLDELEVIIVYRTNNELREHFPEWPGRGHASGGFVGPHRIAAMMAHQESGAPIGFFDS